MQGIKEEIIGKTFGMLTVISEDMERTQKDKERKIIGEIKYPSVYYFAKCGCEKGTIKSYKKSSLLNMATTNCGCQRKSKPKKELMSYVGLKFGNLKIIKESKDKSKCICLCDCGKEIEKTRTYLKTSKIPSCGCLYKEINQYKIDYNNSIVYCYTGRKNIEFIIDLEDYNKIKDYIWVIANGYVRNTNGIKLHNLVMNFDISNNNDLEIDHINRDTCDNRKVNLRISKHCENARNIGIRKNNKSGIIGVYFSNSKNRWIAHIIYNYKCITLKSSKIKEECIIARLKAEKLYFGEFAPQKELFDKYNI